MDEVAEEVEARMEDRLDRGDGLTVGGELEAAILQDYDWI